MGLSWVGLNELKGNWTYIWELLGAAPARSADHVAHLFHLMLAFPNSMLCLATMQMDSLQF